MKSVVVAFLALIFSFQAFAAKDAVYCRVDNKVWDANSEDGFGQCYFALTAYGDACFVGSRAEVIKMINADTFNWDENWLERANFKGSSEIFYVSADGPNEERFPMTMKRCTAEFFRP